MSTGATRQHFDIVVSGASFAGLALARAVSLACDGDLQVALVDRAARTSAAAGGGVRAYALGLGSKRMLEQLGAWQGLESEAQAVTQIEITDSGLDAGVRPVLLTYRNVVAGGEAASFIVPSAAVARELEAVVAASDGITRIAPAEIASFTTGESGVEIGLADGRALSASLLVAADGRKSAVRNMAGIGVVSWPYPQMGIVTTVVHERPHGGKAVQHFLPGGPFAILPLPGNRSCITWSEDAEVARRILALDDAAFLAEVERRFGGRLGALRLDGGRQSWPLEMHLARSYVAPRLALVGDAAHGVHPIAGQGLNLALRDVAALAEVLVDTARLGLDIASASALERYERWRRFDSALSAATFDALNRLFSDDRPLARALRDVGLGLVDRLPRLKSAFVAEAAGLAGELPRLLKGEPV